MSLTPREIIAKAWTITKTVRQVRRWGYASALLETLLNLKLLIYQVWFVISYLQGNPIGFFTLEATIMKYIPFGLFMTFMVILIILVLIEWIFPHFAKGAIIGLAAKAYQKEEVKGGLVLATYNFFPIFAVHEFFTFGRLPPVITICSILLRYGGGLAPIAIAFMAFLYVASNVLQFFCIFAEEAIVIRKKGIGDALRHSFKLVISYLGQIVFLLILFFVITLRIFINAIMIFLIPGVIIGIGFLLAMIMPPVVGYAIGSILGLIIIGIASYFFAYLEVFRQTVWTLTYMELSKLKELDVIEID